MTAARRLIGRDDGSDNRGWDALMAAAQRGDPAAYRRLLSQTTIWLRSYYARRLPSAMIEDAIQETVVAVHEKRHTYDPSRPFGAWLAAIARYNGSMLCARWRTAPRKSRMMTSPFPTMKKQSRALGPLNDCSPR